MENELPVQIVGLPESPTLLSRWQAAGIHFLISVIVALAVVATMYFLWYPTPYFQAMGGDGLLMLVVGVDVVLGPLITLIIFNTKKKSLKFDLMCIAILQMVALAYGVSTMFQARPVYTVFNNNRFDVVIAAGMNVDEQAKVTNAMFKSLPIAGPQIVAMELPNEKKELEHVLFSGIDSRAFSQYYVAYDAKAKEAQKLLPQPNPSNKSKKPIPPLLKN
jgi:hypothetical protein